MAISYIQITQDNIFPASSNVGKAVVGVNTSSQIAITNNNGTTVPLTGSLPPYTASYNVYTAKLTNEYPGSASTITVIPTILGVIYLIHGASDGDFSNVGAPNNNDGTFFVSTGGTPTSYGSATLVRYTQLPAAIVQENTLGFLPLWEQVEEGVFGFTFPFAVDLTKVVTTISSNSTNNIKSFLATDALGYNVVLVVNDVNDSTGTLNQTSIEIRQYL